MLTVPIRDEQLAQKLQELAAQQNRTVEEMMEDVAKEWVARHELLTREVESDLPKEERLKRVRHRIYNEAREYWQSAGEMVKAALTDVEMDEQFGAFDEEGVPRLKSELEGVEPAPGTLAYAGKIIRESGGMNLGNSIDAAKADDILNEEFADYLLNRMKNRGARE